MYYLIAFYQHIVELWCHAKNFPNDPRIKEPIIDGDLLKVPLLVFPLTYYNDRVPVIIGINVIGCLKAVSTENNNTPLPDGRGKAFKALCDTHVGLVKSSNRVVLQLMDCKTVVGFTQSTKYKILILLLQSKLRTAHVLDWIFALG